MTDRELLELAAKAAGIELRWSNEGVAYAQRDDGYWGVWNPLTDDGDALRLAVKLALDIEFILEDVPEGFDPYADTRRAIVRAAAEIGKEME